MKTYTVAVLGATGAVGQEMIKVLQERNFPVGKLVPLASCPERGQNREVPRRGRTIQEATDAAFRGVDIVWVRRKTTLPRNLPLRSWPPGRCSWTIPLRSA